MQDNLNTHTRHAFYRYLPADEAFARAQKFEFFFTPKAASWLNMIEIAFSALARGCLNRRIATQAELRREVLAFFQEREAKPISEISPFKITRSQFSTLSWTIVYYINQQQIYPM